MNVSRFAALAAAASVLMAGCATDVPLDAPKNAPVENRSPLDSSKNGATTNGTPQTQVANVDLTNNNAANAAARVVYFDLDSYVVKDEYRPVIEAQAKLLSANRAKKLVVEGHTDERGGSEYNLALGQ